MIGMQVGDSRSEASWSGFLQGRKDRGLADVDLVTSEDHRATHPRRQAKETLTSRFQFMTLLWE